MDQRKLAWVIQPPRVMIRTGLGAVLLPPVSGSISSDFGPRVQPTAGASTDHKGIDYAVPVGTVVAASAPGRVSFAGVQSGFGNVVQIDHGGGVVTTYGHLSSLGVSVGQQVAAGQFIGFSGATGTVTGPNLHFGVSLNGVYVDPESYLLQASLPTVLPDLVASPAAPMLEDPNASPNTAGVDGLTLGILAALVGAAVLVAA